MKVDPFTGTISRTNDANHPYLQEDLTSSATGIPVHSWAESKFALSKGGLKTWADEISALNWFHDEVIQNALGRYCRAGEEKDRYQPFVELTNRIIKLGRGALTGVRDKYPVDDFCFANSSTNEIQTIEEHEGLGARRKPDVLGLRRAVANKLEKATSATEEKSKAGKAKPVRWVDILTIVEHKFSKKLREKLDAERRARALSPPERTDNLTVAVDEVCEWRKIPYNVHDVLNGLHLLQEVPASHAAVLPVDLAGGNLLTGIASYTEIKDMKTEAHVAAEVAIQGASYALELLSCTYGTRVSCFSAIMNDDAISLWYYDASGIIHTTDFVSLITHFEIFAAIIVGFANCTPEQFGVLPLDIVRPHVPYSRKFPPENLEESTLYLAHPKTKEQVAVTLDQSIFTQYVLVGRRTFVYSINTDPMVPEKELIMKMSYQVRTRRQEHELVRIAKRAKVRHLPRIHMWGDLWKLSDGVRDSFYTSSGGKAEYEDRALRAIVYSRYTPIRKVFAEDSRLIPLMVDQMLDCE